MAGGATKYRHLSRKSSHRQALLRNLVTSLFQHESITTTWPKAKEAQRLAEKLITLGKKNTESSRRRALQIFYVRDSSSLIYSLFMGYMRLRETGLKDSDIPFTHAATPHELLPKLFGPLRERYANRPGGYTRVLRVEPKKDDQAPSAILELVDGPKDIRFAMTAKTVARQRSQGFETLNELTALNVKKVTQFRKDGVEALEDTIKQLERMELKEKKAASPKKPETEAKE
ncbi:mitochondrial 54S ribosomal protein YmL8 [Paecilomyces variotii No. 5]|uniref:Mitochondrial 54S ribosomal protein YmL8 n=1 Tax=Byssochlamys spectabilis (strain No. 5 / NBRC 109023) TaxID=1356009 RepID=V5FZZ9_BYSSN|nr:mitochondrial 54S ribosomal protein YmL8 [Paecilomyces variotii No. 5]